MACGLGDTHFTHRVVCEPQQNAGLAHPTVEHPKNQEGMPGQTDTTVGRRGKKREAVRKRGSEKERE